MSDSWATRRREKYRKNNDSWQDHRSFNFEDHGISCHGKAIYKYHEDTGLLIGVCSQDKKMWLFQTMYPLVHDAIGAKHLVCIDGLSANALLTVLRLYLG